MYRKKIIPIIIILAAIAGFFAGVFFGGGAEYDTLFKGSAEENGRGAKPEGVNFSVFWEAWQLIQANFIGAEILDRDNMVYGAVSGLAESLGDPNTEFLGPEETRRFRASIVMGADLPSVEWRLIEGDIAYVQLFRFTTKASNDFEKIGREILESRAQKIILDLRDNPGGDIDAFIGISEWFFEKGQLIAVESFGENRGERIYKSQGEGLLGAYPLGILINKKTASVAEVFAHSIRESKGGMLLGEPSMGKGSIQKILTLSGDTALRLTTSEFLSPKGHPVSGGGLNPDIEVATLDDESDPQLEKIIQIICAVTPR